MNQVSGQMRRAQIDAFDRESLFPVMTPYIVSGNKNSSKKTNVGSQTHISVSMPYERMKVTHIGACPQFGSITRPRYRNYVPRRPGRLRKAQNPIRDAKMQPRSNFQRHEVFSDRTGRSNLDKVGYFSDAKSNSKKGRKQDVAPHANRQLRSKKEPKRQAQQQFAEALIFRQGITVDQVFSGLHQNGVDDFRETVAAVVSCSLQVKSRSQKLASFSTSQPNLEALAAYLAADCTAASVSIWIMRSNGTFTVAADTRQAAVEKRRNMERANRELQYSVRAQTNTKNYVDDSFLAPKPPDSSRILESTPSEVSLKGKAMESKLYSTVNERMQSWMSDEEVKLAQKAVGTSSYMTEMRSYDPATSNYHKKGEIRSRAPFKWSILIMPIAGRHETSSGVIILRDKIDVMCDSNVSENNFAKLKSIPGHLRTHFSSADTIIADNAASIATLSAQRFSVDIGTQTELTVEDMNRISTRASLFQLPIDNDRIKNINTYEAINLIETAAADLLGAQKGMLFLLDGAGETAGEAGENMNGKSQGSLVGSSKLPSRVNIETDEKDLPDLSPNKFLDTELSHEDYDSLPWNRRLWALCRSSLKEDGSDVVDKAGRSAKFVSIPSQPTQCVLFVGHADAHTSHRPESYLNDDPYNIVGRVAQSKKTLRTLFNYPDTPFTGAATGQYTHSLIATPIWNSSKADGFHLTESFEEKHLLGVLLVSNKTEDDEKSAALDKIPSFSSEDCALIEGFSLIAGALIRRADALRRQEDDIERARQKRMALLSGNEEMEHWENSLIQSICELSRVNTLKKLYEALHTCCTNAVKCKRVSLVLGSACSHIWLQETNFQKADDKVANDSASAFQDESKPEATLSLEEVMLFHKESVTSKYICWYLPDCEPMSIEKLSEPMNEVMEHSAHIAGEAIRIVSSDCASTDDVFRSSKTSLAVPIYAGQSTPAVSDNGADLPVGFIYCTSAEMYMTDDEIASRRHRQAKARQIDAALDMAFATNTSSHHSASDDGSKSEKMTIYLQIDEIRRLSIQNTEANSREVQSLLYLRLLADQVTDVINRVFSNHEMQFKIARMNTASFGLKNRIEKEVSKSESSESEIDFLAMANLHSMDSMITEESYGPMKISVPLPHSRKIESSKTRSWVPTWWEYIGSCRETLHATQLLLVAQPQEACTDSDSANNVSAEGWVILQEPIGNSAGNEKGGGFTIPFAPAEGVSQWAKKQTSVDGQFQAFEADMPDLQGHQLMQNYYLLPRASPRGISTCDVLPKVYAYLVRAGGPPLSEEEIEFFKASMDVVGSQILLAIKCHAYKNYANRLQLALSVPATLLGVEESEENFTCRRAELLLERSCMILECESGKLSVYNPGWEEMQTVAGWPSLSSSELVSFPVPKSLGVFVEKSSRVGSDSARKGTGNDTFDLRASIVSQNRVIGMVEFLKFQFEPKHDTIQFVETGVSNWFAYFLEKIAMEEVISEVQAIQNDAGRAVDFDKKVSSAVRWKTTQAVNAEFGLDELANQQSMFMSRVVELFNN